MIGRGDIERPMARTGREERNSEHLATWTVLILVAVPVLALFVYTFRRHPSVAELGGFMPWMWMAIWAELLAATLIVARWFQRIGTNSDIDELRQAAFCYRLGGTLALRPFLQRADGRGEALTADSRLEDYNQGVVEPTFFRSAVNPPFFLALALVVTIGLMGLYAQPLQIVSRPSLLLGGPEAADRSWLGGAGPLAGEALDTMVVYQSGALMTVVFGFLGAMSWSLVALARRMALRDVTAHVFQAVTVRIIVSGVVGLFLYHLFGKAGNVPAAPGAVGQAIGSVAGLVDSAGLGRNDVLLLLAFTAGVFPEIALRSLEARIRGLFKQARQSDEMDLEIIEGIDPHTRARLAEVGVYDAQGLVTSNPIRLALHTPFSLPQVMDWLGQAFLFTQLQSSRYKTLRDEQRIRTAWQLHAARLPEGAAMNARLAAAGFDAAEILALLGRDPSYIRAAQIVERMRLE